MNQSPSDSFISAQPSVHAGGRCESPGSVSSLERVVDATNSLKEPIATSQSGPIEVPATGDGPSVTTPFRAVARSYTFDIFRSVVKHTSGRLGFSVQQTTQENLKRRSHRRKHLEERLRSSLNLSPLCNRKFLPDDQLRMLVTAEAVDQELSRPKHIPTRVIQACRRISIIRLEAREKRQGIFSLRSHSTSELLESTQTYRKVFALLAYIERPTCIWDFVSEGICDRDLPNIDMTNKLVVHLGAIGSEPVRPLGCFRGWPSHSKHEFLNKRWMFLAPSFVTDQEEVKHHEFKEDEILPITSWTALSDKGACGQVYKAKIHGSHHAFDKDVVAVKELNSRNRKNFDIESGILRSLGRPNHMSDFLITLLATFERCDKYYLIFPWADGDLEGFWKQVSPEPGMETWLIEQCQGLAQAMSLIHRYDTTLRTQIPHQPPKMGMPKMNDHGALSLIGRHGDIKPANILWFRQSPADGHGILKITDFGIARFTVDNIESKRRQGFTPNSPTYRSPECDLPNKYVGAHCDVWALGCVFLIFVTWFFGGYSEVNNFSKKRQSPDLFWSGMNSDNFFVIESDPPQNPQAKVKLAVRKQIIKLRLHKECTPRLGNLLELIKESMIIIQKELEAVGSNSAGGILEIPRTPRLRRMSAGTVARELG